MMKELTFYDETGKVAFTFHGSEEVASRVIDDNASLSYVTGLANTETQYVVNGVLVDRLLQQTTLDKTTLAADGVDVVTVSNAPSGEITVSNSVTKDVVNGLISESETFSTTIPGIYKIKIESWPYLDFEAMVEAI